jgi:hypothetical protein
MTIRSRRVDNINILERQDGGIYWIGLAQDRDKWRAIANAVMNILVI